MRFIHPCLWAFVFMFLGAQAAAQTTASINIGGRNSCSSEGFNDPGLLSDGITEASATYEFTLDSDAATLCVEVTNTPPVLVVPYSSLLYDAHGNTWVYVSPKDKVRSFRREAVTVDRIEGNDVFLTEGPDAGTVIVKVGVAELYGTESKLGGH